MPHTRATTTHDPHKKVKRSKDEVYILICLGTDFDYFKQNSLQRFKFFCHLSLCISPYEPPLVTTAIPHYTWFKARVVAFGLETEERQ